MHLWELFSKDYFLRHNNGVWSINDRRIDADTAQRLSMKLTDIAVNYPRSSYSKMSNDLLRGVYVRLK